MRKTLIGGLVAASVFMAVFAAAPAPAAHADGIDIQQLIQILVSLGIIPADKLVTIEQMLGVQDTASSTVATSTPLTGTKDGSLAITSISTSTVAVGTPITITFTGADSVIPADSGMGWTGTLLQIEDSSGNTGTLALRVGLQQDHHTYAFTLPSEVCIPFERGCGPDDPASLYVQMKPGVYKLFLLNAENEQSVPVQLSVVAGQSASVAAPYVYSLSPSSATVGSTLVLQALNVDSSKLNSYYGLMNGLEGVGTGPLFLSIVDDSSEVGFTVPQTLGSICSTPNSAPCSLLTQAVTLGTYNFSIVGPNGTSNSIPLTIVASANGNPPVVSPIPVPVPTPAPGLTVTANNSTISSGQSVIFSFDKVPSSAVTWTGVLTCDAAITSGANCFSGNSGSWNGSGSTLAQYGMSPINSSSNPANVTLTVTAYNSDGSVAASGSDTVTVNPSN